MEKKALQLEGIEMERRKAETVATKEFNLAKVSHSGNHTVTNLNMYFTQTQIPLCKQGMCVHLKHACFQSNEKCIKK